MVQDSGRADTCHLYDMVNVGTLDSYFGCRSCVDHFHFQQFSRLVDFQAHRHQPCSILVIAQAVMAF